MGLFHIKRSAIWRSFCVLSDANFLRCFVGIGKTCIVSKDNPVFIVHRMLTPMLNEAIGLLEAGSDTFAVLGMLFGIRDIRIRLV